MRENNPYEPLLLKLEEALESVAVVAPSVSEASSGFIPELRAALSLSDPRAANALRMDSENLRSGVEDLSTILSAGVRSEDTEASEADILRLIRNMRVRCAQAIKDRTRMMRIHTEVSADHSGDPGPSDVTEAFRIVTSRLTDAPENAALRVARVNEDGALGRVRGEVLTFSVSDKRGFDDSASRGTLFLPEDHVITLERGERVLLRHDGVAFDDGPIGKNEKLRAHVVEAQADGVMIVGPATLAVVSEEFPSLRDIWAMLSEMQTDVDGSGRVQKFIGGDNESLGFIVIVALLTLLPAAAIMAAQTDNPNPLHALLFVPSIMILTYGLKLRNKTMRTCQSVKARLLRIWPYVSGWDLNKERFNMQLYMMAIQTLRKNIRRSCDITHRPVDRVMTDASGVLHIRPLPQLPAPSPETVVNFNQRKAKA